MIAGLLKAPARFNPTRDRDLAAARTAQVLANMVQGATSAQARPEPPTANKAPSARSRAPVRETAISRIGWPYSSPILSARTAAT